MRLGRSTNGLSCEYRMQNKFKLWLTEREIAFVDEFYISNISRRPDFLLLIKGNGLVNVEAKCNNHDELILQLIDNATYCRYSFAYIPDYCLTSQRFKTELLRLGFGLIVYNYELEIVTEVFEAHLNKKYDKFQHSNAVLQVEKEIIMRKRRQEKKADPKLF